MTAIVPPRMASRRRSSLKPAICCDDPWHPTHDCLKIRCTSFAKSTVPGVCVETRFDRLPIIVSAPITNNQRFKVVSSLGRPTGRPLPELPALILSGRHGHRDGQGSWITFPQRAGELAPGVVEI